MTKSLDINSLETLLYKLDYTSHDCKDRISILRAMADNACDNGEISRKQWRTLYEELAKIQKKHVNLQPIGFHHTLHYGRFEL